MDLVKNTYRVLLSRGLKGCYVYFMDRDTERYVRSRMETVKERGGAAEARTLNRVAEPQADYRLPFTTDNEPR